MSTNRGGVSFRSPSRDPLKCVFYSIRKSHGISTIVGPCQRLLFFLYFCAIYGGKAIQQTRAGECIEEDFNCPNLP